MRRSWPASQARPRGSRPTEGRARHRRDPRLSLNSAASGRLGCAEPTIRKAASRRAATAAGQPVRAGRQPHIQPPQRPAPYQSDGPSSPPPSARFSRCWAWTTGPTAKPSARSNRSARRDRAADGAPSAATTPHHPKHQHQHHHDDQHPQPCRHGSLLGRRRAVLGDATAAHPSKQLGHRQATSRAGSTAALRPDGLTAGQGSRALSQGL